MKMRLRYIFALLLTFLPAIVSACPSCYNGSTKSARFDGLNAAIMAMVGIVGLVLTGISTFFIGMRRRIMQNRAQMPTTPIVNQKGNIEWNNF